MSNNNSANNCSFSKSEVISICNNVRFNTKEPKVSNLVILAAKMAEKHNGGYFTIRKSNYETGDSKVLAVIKHKWIPEIDNAGYILIDYSNGGVEYIIGETIGKDDWNIIINNYWFGKGGLDDFAERTDIINRLYDYGEKCAYSNCEALEYCEHKTVEDIIKDGGFTDGYYLGDDFASSVLGDSWSEEREDIMWDWDDCFYAGYKKGVKEYFELGGVEVYEGCYSTVVKVA